MARRGGEDGSQPPQKRIWNKNTEFPQPQCNDDFFHWFKEIFKSSLVNEVWPV